MASIKRTKAVIDDFYSRLPSCTIEKVEYRGITINQLQIIYDEIEARCIVEGWKDDLTKKLLTPAEVNLYHIKEKIIKMRTAALQCSYVELIALGEQIAEWFVSHWWGESVLAFIKCLIRHAKDRGLSWDTPYWICAYANNQHPGKIEEEMVGNPFLKAMEISKGTVSILDKDCVVYSRIWCIYELYKSLMDKKDGYYKFDVYTEYDWEYNFQSVGGPTDNGDAIGLTDGFIDGDYHFGSPTPILKTLRESRFPLERILKAGAIDIKKAVASEAKDEKYIKNTITNQNEDDDPPEHHDLYEKLNNLIRGFFVSSSFERILKDDSIESDRKLVYFDILNQSSATVLSLNMLHYTPFDDSVATQLAVCLPSTITSFTFSTDGSSVTLDSIREIFRSLANLTNLDMLVLYKNSIDDDTCLILADAIRNNKNIRELDLRNNTIGDEGMMAISGALQNNDSLELLYLSDNQISVDGAIEMGAAMRVNNTLKKLGLANNKVGDEGVKVLADALLTNHCLEELYLGGNEISDDGAIAISAAMRVNTTVKALILTSNIVGDEGVKVLADALLTNHCLEELYLGDNRISDVGAIAIAAAMKINNTLQKLVLSRNKVGDKGVKALADALLTNHCLEVLYLADNGIADDGAIAIAATTITNNYLKKLSLGDNEIGDKGVIAIAAALKINKTLQELYIDGNGISDEGAIAIADALKLNHSLKHLDLKHNSRISEQTRNDIALLLEQT